MHKALLLQVGHSIGYLDANTDQRFLLLLQIVKVLGQVVQQRTMAHILGHNENGTTADADAAQTDNVRVLEFTGRDRKGRRELETILI